MSPACDALNTTLEWGTLFTAIGTGLFLAARGWRRIRWTALLEGAVITAGFLTYFFVRHLTEGDADRAVANARDLVELERTLGLWWEPDLQATIEGQGCLVATANWVYVWWHWPIIGVAIVWLILYRPEVYRRFRNAFLISGGIGLIIFATYPVAPPRLVPDLGLVDTVSLHSQGYRVLQPPAFTNQYAAMPSLHYGWNLLAGIAIVGHARYRLLRAFGALMPFVMLWAVVATANHFVLDPIVGAALALLGLFVALRARWLWARLRRLRPTRERLGERAR